MRNKKKADCLAEEPEKTNHRARTSCLINVIFNSIQDTPTVEDLLFIYQNVLTYVVQRYKKSCHKYKIEVQDKILDALMKM